MLFRAALLTLTTALLTFAQSGGIPVRPEPTDYSTRNVRDGITVAASVIPPDQVKKLFSKDLSHEGYIVVEVAIWPPTGTPIDLSPDEFAFRVGTNPAILSSQTPAQIAAGDKRSQTASSKPPQLPGNVHVYQEATIGYESGDRRYGQPGGVYTGTRTTVGIGDPGYPQGPGPQPMPRGAKPDWTGVKRELEERELPAGRTALPVAGYLYFLRPATKDKRPEFELDWYRTAGQIRLAIPALK